MDYRKIEDLAKINGDLGRLGGLLKMWLTNDEKLRQFNTRQLRTIIAELLIKIESNQDDLRDVIQTVLKES